MELRPALEDAMQQSLLIVREYLREELAAQGHPLTGRLSQSFTFSFSETADVFRGAIEAEEYAIYIDAGVSASRVRYPIRVMIRYFLLRGLPAKEAKSAAYATRAIHQREGIPTRGSYAFSKNGRRTGFIKQGVNGALSEVADIFEKRIGHTVEAQIFKILQPSPEALKLELLL